MPRNKIIWMKCSIALFCTGDNPFPLSTDMIKPYQQSNLANKKWIFNDRLSRMRGIFKKGFGILTIRWRVFRNSFMLEPEKMKAVTLVTITLLNWLQEVSENRKIYIPKGLINNENIEMNEIFEGSWGADGV